MKRLIAEILEELCIEANSFQIEHVDFMIMEAIEDYDEFIKWLDHSKEKMNENR